jgi:hypothetical protein
MGQGEKEKKKQLRVLAFVNSVFLLGNGLIKQRKGTAEC